jgi:hypothetical protein
MRVLERGIYTLSDLVQGLSPQLSRQHSTPLLLSPQMPQAPKPPPQARLVYDNGIVQPICL